MVSHCLVSQSNLRIWKTIQEIPPKQIDLDMKQLFQVNFDVSSFFFVSPTSRRGSVRKLLPKGARGRLPEQDPSVSTGPGVEVRRTRVEQWKVPVQRRLRARGQVQDRPDTCFSLQQLAKASSSVHPVNLWPVRLQRDYGDWDVRLHRHERGHRHEADNREGRGGEVRDELEHPDRVPEGTSCSPGDGLRDVHLDGELRLSGTASPQHQDVHRDANFHEDGHHGPCDYRLQGQRRGEHGLLLRPRGRGRGRGLRAVQDEVEGVLPHVDHFEGPFFPSCAFVQLALVFRVLLCAQRVFFEIFVVQQQLSLWR